MPSQILLVDDHPVMRDGIGAIVASAHDFEVCGVAATADEAKMMLARGPLPDILITDLSLPGMSGLDLVKHVRALYDDLPILVLSAHSESVYADRVIRAGAQGYVMKSAGSAQILKAVREVAQGDIALSQEARSQMIGSYLGRENASPIERLSDREAEVFVHLGNGRSTVETAEAMCISRKTVESHRANIKRKLDIKTSNELVQRAAVWVVTGGGVPSPA
jgi:DNA-binding NarL/FixJ family response regulator